MCLSKTGPEPTALFVTDAPIPVPTAGKLRLKLFAASINPVDSKFPFWLPMVPASAPQPFVLGVDGAGCVDALGEGVTEWAVGDRVAVHVFLIEGAGTFAEYCLADAAACVRLQPGISFEAAAAVPCAGWTAYKALVIKSRLSPSQSVLITGGNGGVGGFACQIARVLGAGPIITTCSPAAFERVKALGATHAIDYHSPDIVAQVRAIVPAGVNCVLDCVSSESATSLLPCLAIDGSMCAVAGVVSRGGAGDSYMQGWSVHDISLGGAAYRSGIPESLAAIGEAFSVMMSSGEWPISPMIQRVVALHEVPALLGMSSVGKIVVRIADE